MDTIQKRYWAHQTIGRYVPCAGSGQLDISTRRGANYTGHQLSEVAVEKINLIDAAFFGIALPDNVPATIQDRAYTSPVWYTPQGD